MQKPHGPELRDTPSASPMPASTSPRTPATSGGSAPTTNSWARRTVLSRALEIGLPQEVGRQVGSLALWYYNRIVLLHHKKESISQELPLDTNKYLVPITLALACDNKGLAVGLDRMLQLSGDPTKRTIEIAHRWYDQYSRILATPAKGAAPVKRPAAPAAGVASRVAAPSARAGYQLRPSTTPKTHSPGHPKSSATRPAPGVAGSPSTTALAFPASAEVRQLRRLVQSPPPPTAGSPPPPRAGQPNTNAWARNRISLLSRSLGLPESVRNRSLEFYEKIVALHSKKAGLPPGRRVQLSPRLNWSLTYTTLYLGCRFEEHPKDLRDILGKNPSAGSVREIYGLYRFYKHELKLRIRLVDVRTFILSWFDGLEIGELLHERTAGLESEKLKNRAIAIATRAREAKALQSSGSRIIAAGALTTALAERNPPSSRHSFYRAMADFLHMSEETIRYIVARIGEIL